MTLGEEFLSKVLLIAELLSSLKLFYPQFIFQEI